MSFYDEAMELQKQGYNCAETVMMMAGKYYLPDIEFDYSNLVTGFGGGIGRSRVETCGALTGSIVALSMLVGRGNPEVSVDPIHFKMSAFRDIFYAKFKNTICEKLREGLEGDAAKQMCHEMTAETVEMLFMYMKTIGIERKG
jgi:C_GCAxxG_C_C family probable redox protein